MGGKELCEEEGVVPPSLILSLGKVVFSLESRSVGRDMNVECYVASEKGI